MHEYAIRSVQNKNVINILVDGIPLKQVEYTKFLGVWIDEKMCWRLHLEKTILKLKQNLNLLKVSKKFLNVHAKRLIYFAHIQSHIVYCISVWGCMLSDTQLSKLQYIQDNCIKLIDCRKNNNDLGILKISDIPELKKLKFCYNYLHDAIPSNMSTCVGTDLHGNSLIKNHS